MVVIHRVYFAGLRSCVVSKIKFARVFSSTLVVTTPEVFTENCLVTFIDGLTLLNNFCRDIIFVQFDFLEMRDTIDLY